MYKVVSKSSAKVEYRVLTLAPADIVWLQSLLLELKVSQANTPVLFTDITSAKYLAVNPVMHARMKHVEIDFHFIRYLVIEDKFDVLFAPTDEQVANVLTKPLGESRFMPLKTKLTMLLPISA